MIFSDYDKNYLARPEKFIKYIVNPKKLVNDFFASQWKVGFLKNLFKINAPYFILYKLMKQMYQGEK